MNHWHELLILYLCTQSVYLNLTNLLNTFRPILSLSWSSFDSHSPSILHQVTHIPKSLAAWASQVRGYTRQHEPARVALSF